MECLPGRFRTIPVVVRPRRRRRFHRRLRPLRPCGPRPAAVCRRGLEPAPVSRLRRDRPRAPDFRPRAPPRRPDFPHRRDLAHRRSRHSVVRRDRARPPLPRSRSAAPSRRRRGTPRLAVLRFHRQRARHGQAPRRDSRLPARHRARAHHAPPPAPCFPPHVRRRRHRHCVPVSPARARPSRCSVRRPLRRC